MQPITLSLLLCYRPRCCWPASTWYGHSNGSETHQRQLRCVSPSCPVHQWAMHFSSVPSLRCCKHEPATRFGVQPISHSIGASSSRLTFSACTVLGDTRFWRHYARGAQRRFLGEKEALGARCLTSRRYCYNRSQSRRDTMPRFGDTVYYVSVSRKSSMQSSGSGRRGRPGTGSRH